MSTTITTPDDHRWGSLAEALAAFQRAIPGVRKGQTAQVQSAKGTYSYDYADLADVTEAAMPLLAAEGLAFTASLTEADGMMRLDWALIHAHSDDRIDGTIPVGRVGDSWQNIGSSITYARRYAFTAATGVAPGGDDRDGADTTAGRERREPPAPPVKEYLPIGLYDLAAVQTKEAAERMFYVARGAGHLNLIVGLPDGGEATFGDWLRATGSALTVEAASGQEATADAQPDAEAILAAEVAAHEAELAAAEARETATAPRADDDAPQGDR